MRLLLIVLKSTAPVDLFMWLVLSGSVCLSVSTLPYLLTYLVIFFLLCAQCCICNTELTRGLSCYFPPRRNTTHWHDFSASSEWGFWKSSLPLFLESHLIFHDRFPGHPSPMWLSKGPFSLSDISFTAGESPQGKTVAPALPRPLFFSLGILYYPDSSQVPSSRCLEYFVPLSWFSSGSQLVYMDQSIITRISVIFKE